MMNQPNEVPTLDGSFPRKGVGNPAFTEEYANDTLRTLFERRTIRRYTDRPVDPHDLDVIIDVGLRAAIRDCDSVIVGAGAGLSTAAGLTYTGERFERYFGDFAAKYGFRDMYSGGFYLYPTPEEHWAYWSRYIWINRYAPIPKDTYAKLRELVGGKDFFVITTNVDHCFQRVDFDKKRLFYTQGDYGLFQCSLPCRQETWDNHDTVLAMVESQGFVVEDDGALSVPDGVTPAMKIPGELVPTCPHCGRLATTNLRADSTFVEDAGWHVAAERYGEFLRTRTRDDQKVLFLELGVGGNTPVIIKYPFWRMASDNPNATYACVNLGEAHAPREIAARSICLNADIDTVLDVLVTGPGLGEDGLS